VGWALAIDRVTIATDQRQQDAPAVSPPAFIFDLDGTLIDSVYQHVIAWRQALEQVGVELAIWKIHRRIGMSGGLMVTALLRELEHQLPDDVLGQLPELHARAYETQLSSVRPLPGACELLSELTANDVPWIIATSGSERFARPGVASLGLEGDVPMVTRDAVRYAKPDPDLFLAGADRLGVDIGQTLVVGDAVWDMLAARRAGALGIGLLSGGYGREELLFSGAFRVYEDAADLLDHLDEVGVRRPLKR
jgi:HAD superfamily hydrolase (TIGR01509 family)